MSTGSKIRKLRERRAFTQVELAERAGIDRSHLRRIEQGEIETPQLSTLYQIVEAMEINPDLLTRYVLREIDDELFLELCEQAEL